MSHPITILLIKVLPASSKNSIEGCQEGIWKIKIHAPPEKGKANEELIVFLSELLHLPKSHFKIISGHTSRLKKVEIAGDIDFSLYLPAVKKKK